MKRMVALAVASALSFAAQAQTTTTTTAPAAGASTGSVAEATKDANAKKFGFSFATEIDTSVDVIKNNQKAEYKAISSLGVNYAVTEKSKIALKHYFTYTVPSVETGGVGKGVMNDTVLQFSTKTAGVLGSDELAPLFWYYAPTSDVSRNLNSNGKVRMDLEVDWALNPSWTVGYYFNPRQSFVPKSDTLLPGSTLPYESRTTLIHYGIATYNVSDKIQAYSYAGFIHSMITTAQTMADESIYSGIGVSFTLGKFTINPEINNEMAIKKDKLAKTDGTLWNNDDVTYALTLAASF